VMRTPAVWTTTAEAKAEVARTTRQRAPSFFPLAATGQTQHAGASPRYLLA
jgi:hypothetical protein